MIAFVSSFLTCVVLICLMWQQRKEHPVLMSTNQEDRPISEIPIPAMTICPLIKSRTDIFDYSSVYRHLVALDGKKTQAPNATEYKNILNRMIY